MELCRESRRGDNGHREFKYYVTDNSPLLGYVR